MRKAILTMTAVLTLVTGGLRAATPKAPKPRAADGKLSCIDAAAKVLGEKKEPMTTKEMIEAMAAKGYWSSPNGQTPAATLYSAILREIKTKGKEARFEKSEKGQGWRTLSRYTGEDFRQEIRTPSASAAFHDQTHLLVGVLFDQPQCKAA